MSEEESLHLMKTHKDTVIHGALGTERETKIKKNPSQTHVIYILLFFCAFPSPTFKGSLHFKIPNTMIAILLKQ